MKLKYFIVMVVFVGVSRLFAGEFTLYSNDFAGQLTKTQEASVFGCDGQNVSPELHWTHAPLGTKSFAVTLYDPDAPTGSGWWHWIVFNIPATTTSLPSDFGNTTKKQTLLAIQSMTDYGRIGFGGACPPKGDKAHRYVFTVYALSVDKLPLSTSSMPALVGFMLNANAIAKASMVSYYKR